MNDALTHAGMDANMEITELFSLRGRMALVTGSSRGIGRSIGLGLAAAGADVVFHGVSNPQAAAQAAAEAQGYGVRAFAVQADLSTMDGVRELFAKALDLLGQIDILVPNVSIQLRVPWPEITRDQYELQMGVNFRSTFELIQLALPGMIERRWGRVMTVGSVQEVKPHAEMLIYAASKAAIANMVRNLAKQVAQHGVTVNNLAPGVFDTPRNADALSDPAYRQRVQDAIPVGFIAEPIDTVGAALLLCSEAGRYITGIDLLVDGGFALP